MYYFLGRLGGSVSWASDFHSGHDLTVRRSSPTSGSTVIVWSLLGILSLSFSLCSSPLPHAFSLSRSFKINKQI